MKQGVPTDSLDGFDTTGVVDGDLLRYDDTTQVFVCFAPTDLIKDGTGITWAYNSALGTLTPTVSLASFSTTNLPEGTNLYFTTERAQDAVLAVLTDSSSIDFTYDDAGNSLTAVVRSDSITDAMLANMAQATVKGRASGAGTGDPTDLSAAQVAAIVASAVATSLNITSGVYTPSISLGVNMDAATAYQCQYLRVGSVVTVSGRVGYDTTAIGAASQFRMTLPIASDFGAFQDAGGTAQSSGSDLGAAIAADPTNNVVTFYFVANGTIAQDFFFSFTYRII